MFDGCNLKNCLPTKTVYIGKPIHSNDHNYSIGRPEWQEKWTTTTKVTYTEKDLRDNHCVLPQPYLIPNHSNFEIGYSSNNVYQSTTKKDYKPIGYSGEKMAEWEKENRFYVQNNKKIEQESLLNVGYNDSMAHATLQDPKKQKTKFDYDAINFKYNQYFIDPITHQEKLKDPDRLWSYEYYNRDKKKGHPHLIDMNAHPPMTKKEQKKMVWDPIANRFFECRPENKFKL